MNVSGYYELGKVLGGYHVGRCMWMIGHGTPPCLAMGHGYNEKVFSIHIPSTIDLEWCIIGCWLTLAHILWEKATYYGKGFAMKWPHFQQSS